MLVKVSGIGKHTENAFRVPSASFPASEPSECGSAF